MPVNSGKVQLKNVNKCLLIDARTLDFTDFSPDIWYNICKGFNKIESFSLQIF